MQKIILSIEGMTCSACSNGLEKYLNKQDGIKSASVNLVMANASIEYDEEKINLSMIEEFVEEAGFKSAGEFKEIKFESKTKKEKIKFVIYTVLAIVLMYVSMGHMLKLPIIDFFNIDIKPINYTICLFVFSIIFIIYGFDILKNGYKNLIHKTPNMDTLVGIGVLSSFIYSIYNMIMVLKGNAHAVHNLYFETTAIVIYFVKLGRFFEGISTNKTKEAIQKLVKITPKDAVILIDGKEKRVTIDEIQKGDIVVAKPGEKIAVDGVIIEGKTHLDEAFITGESKPTNKTVGDKVIAGSINFDGYIEYRAEKIGKESTISEIVKLVVEASNTKPNIARVADKASSYFVPLVIIIAILTFLGYILFTHDISISLVRFVTVLVVACPCSLGLATPLAIVVAEGVCANSGVLIKKSDILEQAQKVNTIVFDKTGTLTYGKIKIAEVRRVVKENKIIKLNLSDEETKNILQIAGSIEAKSTHPISKAFEEYIQENNIRLKEVEDFENISGYGIVGKIEGKEVLVGNAKLLEKYNIKNDDEEIYKVEKQLADYGNSIVYVVYDNKIKAIIGVNDVLRENSKEVITSLNDKKIETIMLTGDNKQTAERIAQNIGIIKVISNVLPSEKTDIINNLKEENKKVIMCGDGINDSPALATADIGISVSSGTDIAMDSSDVILTRNDLSSILKLINISKATIRNIKQNLFWAFFYNILMIPIAIGILSPYGIIIDPMIASIAMFISSITVILNALRLKTKKCSKNS